RSTTCVRSFRTGTTPGQPLSGCEGHTYTITASGTRPSSERCSRPNDRRVQTDPPHVPIVGRVLLDPAVPGGRHGSKSTVAENLERGGADHTEGAFADSGRIELSAGPQVVE